MLAGSWLSDMETCAILKKLGTPPISAPTLKSRHRAKTQQHKNTLLTPLPVFSPQSRDELFHAVDDCCRDEISSEGDRLTRLYGPIGKWDVTKVTDMSKIFSDLDYFDYALSDWDVSRVTNMHGMFASALYFNQDLSKWDVSRVTNMRGMFDNAVSFNQDLSKWDVSRVTDMHMMFSYAKSFNQDLSYWDVSRVIHMQWMFDDAISFNQTLCGAAWVNSKASKVGMFTSSPGSISDTVYGVWMLW